MKRAILALAVLLSLAHAAEAQPAPPLVYEDPPDPADPAQPALIRLPSRENIALTVTSPAFETGGDIPPDNTQYGANRFPGLAWTPGPAGTRTYAVILQDTDMLARGAPVLHWVIVDVPATLAGLTPGMIAPPPGALYGPNYKGGHQPYLGPRTPPGPKHHYHFQVFALDTVVPEAATVSYDALLDAMNDHILASGETVGLGQAPP